MRRHKYNLSRCLERKVERKSPWTHVRYRERVPASPISTTQEDVTEREQSNPSQSASLISIIDTPVPIDRPLSVPKSYKSSIKFREILSESIVFRDWKISWVVTQTEENRPTVDKKPSKNRGFRHFYMQFRHS